MRLQRLRLTNVLHKSRRVILAALYYVVFTPIALVFRLMRRDALRRRRSTAASYWTPKPQPDDPTQYFKQF